MRLKVISLQYCTVRLKLTSDLEALPNGEDIHSVLIAFSSLSNPSTRFILHQLRTAAGLSTKDPLLPSLFCVVVETDSPLRDHSSGLKTAVEGGWNKEGDGVGGGGHSASAASFHGEGLTSTTGVASRGGEDVSGGAIIVLHTYLPMLFTKPRSGECNAHAPRYQSI